MFKSYDQFHFWHLTSVRVISIKIPCFAFVPTHTVFDCWSNPFQSYLVFKKCSRCCEYCKMVVTSSWIEIQSFWYGFFLSIFFSIFGGTAHHSSSECVIEMACALNDRHIARLYIGFSSKSFNISANICFSGSSFFFSLRLTMVTRCYRKKCDATHNIPNVYVDACKFRNTTTQALVHIYMYCIYSNTGVHFFFCFALTKFW